MAVIIIKEGNHPKDELWSATCPCCQSELECTQHDMKPNPSKGCETAQCPLCETWVITWKRTGKYRRPDPDGDSGK